MFGEVLPSIRKSGGYLLNEEARDTAHADDRQGMPMHEAFARSRRILTVTRVLRHAALASYGQTTQVRAGMLLSVSSRFACTRNISKTCLNF